MKKNFKYILSVLFILSFTISGISKEMQVKDNGIILVISSYSPDSKRISCFMKDFEAAVVGDGEKYKVYLEDLACNHLVNCDQWIERLDEILINYEKKDLKAVIILGQEAWASFSSLKGRCCNIPVFVCYGSVVGFDITTYTDSSQWFPKSVNLLDKARESNTIGGQVFSYFVKENIELILDFFPATKNIALITDNSYGGISLRARVSDDIQSYRNLSIINIDSRDLTIEETGEVIKNLPSNTAVLVGTWRVGKEGIYYMTSTLSSIIISNPNVPFFSILGTGMGDNVIGGYIPQFNYSPVKIYSQIDDFYTQGTIPKVEIIPGHYILDERMIEKMGIKSYQLPDKYTTVNFLEQKLKTYRHIIYLSLVILAILLTCIAMLSRLYFKHRLLKKELIVNNEELREAKEKAEESDKMKSSFLANMSHEIRTPLNSIVGFSNLLCEEGISNEDRKEYKEVILKNTDSLLKLINDILDISRLESGKIKFNLVKCDIISVCHNAMISIVPMHKKGVEYIFNPPVDKFQIMTDEIRLRQVIVNFIINATKFTENGFIELSLEINKPDNKILFIVTDTGCGIPQDKRDKIFNRFEKLDEFQKGFGLGLAISLQIADKIGGSIYLDPEYKNGTRIIFEHPIELSISNLLRWGGGGRLKINHNRRF